MFKDARALDRQRTATSFDRALATYTKVAESWFDGTVQSVDRRLAQCDRLLHTARATVARMTISDSNRYLAAAERLSDDRRVLEGLRDDLLTGASNRRDVTGPPAGSLAMLLTPSPPATSTSGVSAPPGSRPPMSLASRTGCRYSRRCAVTSARRWTP